MRAGHYANLIDKKVVLVNTDEPEALLKWAKEFEKGGQRIVAKTKVGDAEVSTVFLGLNHGWPPGPALWFETMIFGGKEDSWQDRYETYDEALAGHERVVAALKEGTLESL